MSKQEECTAFPAFAFRRIRAIRICFEFDALPSEFPKGLCLHLLPSTVFHNLLQLWKVLSIPGTGNEHKPFN